MALAWAGCSDDDLAPATTYVDPGGTFGAELTVTVKGRGRVKVEGQGLDCPSDCFAKYIFPSSGADGAAGGIKLKASATPGSRFSGWSFNTTEAIASGGRGPNNCNPVKRPGAQASVDPKAPEITLPFGEVDGTPPPGQEAACSGFTKVPTVYNIVAEFETDPPPPPPDAGPQDDGGAGDVAFTLPISYSGAVGRDLGIMASSYLFWHFDYAGQSGIAYIPNPKGVASTANVIVAPTTQFSVFEVDSYGLAYQESFGSVKVIRYGTTSPVTMGGVSPTCLALAVDSNYNVYCRTSSSIVQWLYPSYSTPTTLYTGLASGSDLLVESSSGSMYFSTASAVSSLPILGADASAGTPTTHISGASNGTNLEANGSRFYWLNFGGAVMASSTRSAGSALDTMTQDAGMKHLALDVSNTSYVWTASSNAIYHAYYGGPAAAPFRTGVSVNGLTADTTYVYWSSSDGRIRRASVF